MAENSKIEWTHHTFNPWRGCTKVSDGCKHCYAETMSKRNPAILGKWGDNGTRVPAVESYWKQPLKWSRDAQAAGERRRVFCASLADVFEDHPAIMAGWRARLGDIIYRTPHLDWLLLTKRPENVNRLLPDFWINFTEPYGMPANVWLGTTVENQEQADKRIPELLKIPAAVRFLSCEPLLGPVDLGYSLMLPNSPKWGGSCAMHFAGICPEGLQYVPPIHWVIAGGESGPNARPMHPDWARSLRDQCAAAGVPFHFKQWGEWKPFCEMSEEENRSLYRSNHKAEEDEDQDKFDDVYGRSCKVETSAIGFGGDVGLNKAFWVDRYGNDGHAGMQVFKIGKKAAGRVLDGRTWDELPQFAIA